MKIGTSRNEHNHNGGLVTSYNIVPGFFGSGPPVKAYAALLLCSFSLLLHREVIAGCFGADAKRIGEWAYNDPCYTQAESILRSPQGFYPIFAAEATENQYHIHQSVIDHIRVKPHGISSTLVLAATPATSAKKGTAGQSLKVS